MKMQSTLNNESVTLKTKHAGQRQISRRQFLANMGLASVATLLMQIPGALKPGWIKSAHAATIDEVSETFNGLLSFVVPGPDVYSAAQGVSTAEPGGIDANVTEILIETLDLSTPFLPNFSAIVATILNDLAGFVNPIAPGDFSSHFARLAFAEKVAVFQIMDNTDSLKALGGILPAFSAFVAYSEAGVFDAETRSLTAFPVGWAISNYQGVADGRDEFKGYFNKRRKTKTKYHKTSKTKHHKSREGKKCAI